MAATDLGSALAVGAFGLSKDLVEAERYLRIGIEGGDVSAQRNLGLMLLDVDGRLDDAVRELYVCWYPPCSHSDIDLLLCRRWRS